MSGMAGTGLFGKLPAYGDFIYRDLPSDFIQVLDTFLQGLVGGSREQLGETWLDIYLTSPIWRFAFSEGVVDGQSWAGLFLPSVDRVGRYFPFAIARPLPVGASPTDFIASQGPWFDAMEDLALRALEGELNIDELLAEMNLEHRDAMAHYQRLGEVSAPSKMVVTLAQDNFSTVGTMPLLLDSCLKSALPSYSVWSTRGSEYVEPCVFISQNLPSIGGIAAMIDGRWQDWGWQQPFSVVAEAHVSAALLPGDINVGDRDSDGLALMAGENAVIPLEDNEIPRGEDLAVADTHLDFVGDAMPRSLSEVDDLDDFESTTAASLAPLDIDYVAPGSAVPDIEKIPASVEAELLGRTPSDDDLSPDEDRRVSELDELSLLELVSGVEGDQGLPAKPEQEPSVTGSGPKNTEGDEPLVTDAFDPSAWSNDEWAADQDWTPENKDWDPEAHDWSKKNE